jgi:hypothetical protein
MLSNGINSAKSSQTSIKIINEMYLPFINKNMFIIWLFKWPIYIAYYNLCFY